MTSQQDFFNQLQPQLNSHLSAQSMQIGTRINQWFNNCTVRQKVGLGYLAALSVAILGTGSGIILGDLYQRQAWEQVEHSRREISLLSRLQSEVLQARTHQQQLIPLASDLPSFKQEYAHLQKHRIEVEQAWKDLQVFLRNTHHGNEHHSEEIPQFLQTYENTSASYFQALKPLVARVQGMDLRSADEIESARAFLLEFTNSPTALKFDDISDALSTLIASSYGEAEETEKLLVRADDLRVKMIVFSMLGSTALAALLAWYVSRAIARPLKNVTEITHQVLDESNFDLQAPITTGDEIGTLTAAINKLIYGVRRLLIEQTSSEEALRDSEQKFRSLYEMTSDAVMLMGDQGFLDCNSATLNLLGCTHKAQIIGHQPIDFAPEFQPDGMDSVAAAAQHIQTTYQQGSHRFEWLTRRLDGTLFFTEVLLTPIDFGNDQLIQCVVRDITEQKRVESALRERATQLRTQNQVLNRLTKHAAVTQGILEFAAQAIAEATATTLNVERVSIWLYDQPKTRLNCIELYQLAADTHSQGMQLDALDYPNYFRALEQGESIVASQALLDSQTLEFVESYFKPLGVVSLLDCPIRMAGDVVGILCIEQVREVREWSPEDESFTRAIADITALAIEARDRRLADLTLQQKQEELQQTLAELRRTQTQMVQTEKMSSLGQLVAGVAHEINNPVNFIHGNINHAEGYTQDLLHLIELYQQAYPQPAEEIAEEIDAIDLEFLQQDLPKLLTSMRSGSERIREIVKSLRNFSRLDESELKTVNLHEGLDSTLMILQNRLKAKPDQKGIQVIRDYGTLPEVECYPGQLNQVFMNLLSNAIDALEMEQEEPIEQKEQPAPVASRCPAPCIRICTEVLNDRWVVIRIIDNGSGIPEAIRDRLFDPFFTTKPVGQGTGLGLSISYQIVAEKHGGSLHCQPASDQGTEFVIQLPIQPNLQELPSRHPSQTPVSGSREGVG